MSLGRVERGDEDGEIAMPSEPPKTRFYQYEHRSALWREISRLYEGFAGPEGERKEEFVTVLEDMLVEIRNAAQETRS